MFARVISACETVDQCLRDSGGQVLGKRVEVSACETVVASCFARKWDSVPVRQWWSVLLQESGSQCLRDSGVGNSFAKNGNVCDKGVLRGALAPQPFGRSGVEYCLLYIKKKVALGGDRRRQGRKVGVVGLIGSLEKTDGRSGGRSGRLGRV